ncbi:uncharacterized protein B0J16DRAFT_322058 [Fusarium flagelliforme]|uniref:uncharacterized protein n=1 Tax=Fusarium flagelliforme TaxID=2675880 RepID=UPI001E8E2A71|nr:uncharacterized protein B0J16DRAFT_322058 [Fusarium flagelliforme]KAH7183319.1 hypothetical protein B0J16DRAFT_322058 [Fusarium flagelliforme]
MIWLKALSYERYIRIRLIYPPDDAHSSRSYDIKFWDTEEQDTKLIMHPLLYTCPESRKIAKMFYRIQFSWECGEDGITKLYLCPELDILEISWQRFNFLVEFATDCFNRDRDRKGLLNVVLPFPRTFGLNWFPIDKEAAKAAVYRLRHVILEGHVNPTISSDRHSLEKPYSVPTDLGTRTLDHFAIDPRGIDKLARLGLLGHGLREAKNEWQNFLDLVEIDQFKCSFEQSIRLFRAGWRSGLTKPRSVLPSVKGFWIVPMEAFQEGDGDEATDYVDLRDYPPELYVAHPGSTDREESE